MPAPTIERVDDGATSQVQLVIGVDVEVVGHRRGLDAVEVTKERSQLLDRHQEAGWTVVGRARLSTMPEEFSHPITFALVRTRTVVIENSDANNRRTPTSWSRQVPQGIVVGALALAATSSKPDCCLRGPIAV
ncbi:MAG: hypothetical protein ABIQ13_06125 [Pedococcus sp.]